AWHAWDVAEFEGKRAVLQIVDDHTGGWGHINVDHIVQSDRRWQEAPARRDLVVQARYLHLPVQTGAAKRRMTFRLDGKVLREFEIELADGEPDFWAFSDVSALKGRRLRVEVDSLAPDSRGLSAITQGDELKGKESVYGERHRPQFHFTSRRG